MSSSFIRNGFVVMVVLNIVLIGIIMMERTPRASAAGEEVLVLSASEFRPWRDESTYQLPFGNDLTGGGDFFAPVRLPVGATVTRMGLVGYDNLLGGTEIICATLATGSIQSGSESAIASTCSNDAPGDFQKITSVYGGGHTVKFGNTYSVRVFLGDEGQIRLHGVAIFYTP